MKSHVRSLVVFIGTVGVALAFPWGLLQPVHDTPEVAAAKQTHFAAHAAEQFIKASLKAHDRSWSEDDGSWRDDGSWKNFDDGSWRDDTQSWNQYQSNTHWGTHEKKWTGPIALPPGYDKNGAPLQVLDTPEVAAEKSKHFYLYSHAAAKAAPPKWHH